VSYLGSTGILFHLPAGFMLHSDHFARWWAVQCSPALQFAISQGPHDCCS